MGNKEPTYAAMKWWHWQASLRLPTRNGVDVRLLLKPFRLPGLAFRLCHRHNYSSCNTSRLRPALVNLFARAKREQKTTKAARTCDRGCRR